jgi:hypothetical protein
LWLQSGDVEDAGGILRLVSAFGVTHIKSILYFSQAEDVQAASVSKFFSLKFSFGLPQLFLPLVLV